MSAIDELRDVATMIDGALGGENDETVRAWVRAIRDAATRLDEELARQRREIDYLVTGEEASP